MVKIINENCTHHIFRGNDYTGAELSECVREMLMTNDLSDLDMFEL